MNLYRLDYSDGRPVTDALGPVLLREHGRALQRARAESASSGLRVTVSRITGAGIVRAMRQVWPDGAVRNLSAPRAGMKW